MIEEDGRDASVWRRGRARARALAHSFITVVAAAEDGQTARDKLIALAPILRRANLALAARRPQIETCDWRACARARVRERASVCYRRVGAAHAAAIS